jgi:Asp-tRNA(Asn)/Glu-tRNA(Gln) amidotransferase C subunit
MSLTQEQIARLCKLTSLTQSQDLSVDSVLDSFESLKSIDTINTPESSRSGNRTLILRQDIVSDGLLSDALLDCSKQKKAAHQIILGWIIAWE